MTAAGRLVRSIAVRDPSDDSVHAGTLRDGVSLCMIVRNESGNLAGCLSAVSDLVDEVIVVDTGSTDGTKEIAKKHGANVSDFAWCDDFSAARNESIRLATHKWIFWLDADDRVPPPSREKLRTLFASLGDEHTAYMMSILSPGPDGAPMFEHAHARLFRNRPDVRWELRIHEQIVPSVLRSGGLLSPTGIGLLHIGHADPAVSDRKLERNLRLAELDCAAMPLHPTPMYSRAATLLDLGRATEALVALNLCEALSADPAVRRAIPILKARAYVLEQDLRGALDVVTGALATHSTDGSLLFMELRLRAAMGQYELAEASARAQLLIVPEHHESAVIDHSASEFRARQVLADVLLVQGRAEEAAQEAERVIARRPSYGPGWLTLGEALLASGDDLGFDRVLACLAERDGTELARIVLESERLRRRGEHTAAAERVTDALTRSKNASIVQRSFARMLFERGERGVALADAIAVVLASDPYCVRTRALERSVAGPLGLGRQPAFASRERAARALGPLIAIDR